MFDVDAIRADFPILSREVNGKPLVYLDSGASAQKPQIVIDAITRAYAEEYANVHRGLHFLSNLATDKYEAVRGTIARFLNVADEEQIVFNSGTTEGINTVAYGWAMPRMQAGDEIVLSVMEHHANIVPWHFLRERQGVVLKWVDTDSTGALDPQAVIDAIGPKTKLIAITQLSNVLGTKVDVKAITEAAHAKGVAVLVDGSQGAVHMPVDVQDIGCDFYAVTGHKLYGPTAIGALYGTTEVLEKMRPFNGGGEMIEDVYTDRVTYAEPPYKFEAGTPPILEAIGLGAAIDWISQFDAADIHQHEMALYHAARDGLADMNSVRIFGTTADKGPVLAFSLEGAHAHDIAQILDKYGVAVRAGQHCTQPLMERFGVHSTARASFGIYNTLDEAERFVEAVRKAALFLS